MCKYRRRVHCFVCPDFTRVSPPSLGHRSLHGATTSFTSHIFRNGFRSRNSVALPMINSKLPMLLRFKSFPRSPVLAHTISPSPSTKCSSYSQGTNGDERNQHDNYDSTESVEENKESTMDAAQNMGGKASDWAKEYVQQEIETAESLGETAKETVKKAWGAVTGETDDDDGDGIEDHVTTKVSSQEEKEKVMDQNVVDTRRRHVEDHDHNKY